MDPMQYYNHNNIVGVDRMKLNRNIVMSEEEYANALYKRYIDVSECKRCGKKIYYYHKKRTPLHCGECQKYRKEHPAEIQKEWKEKNRDRVNELHRNWARKNPEKVNASVKRWNESHPERVKELAKAYNETHREERKKQNHENYLKRKRLKEENEW